MSRVRNLVDYQSQTADLDGDATRDLNISGTVTAGAVASANVPDVNLTIAPEVLEIQVDAPDAGQDIMWKWTWQQSTLPYARRTITNSAELNVPLYKEGTYVVNNFAAYDIHGSMTQTHSLYLKWIKSAGTDNLVSWATSAGPISDTHPDINGGTATDVQRITVNVPATITPPTLTNPTVSYTVTNTASGSYTFSGAASGNNPNLGPFYRGGTYTINISATGHPFYFTTDNGTNFSAGTYFGEYTSGVTGSRTDSGTITFTVPAGAPDTLYYQCGNHGAMRGEITVKDLAVETNINGNYVVYFQHTQEGHATPVELRPIPSLVNQMCIVYDAGSGKFVPQDLATYVENTPSFENKIREVAGTAELVVEDGSAVIAKVNVYDDSTYLPLTGNNPGDQAFATDTDILYIWDGSAWQQAGAANSDDLTEGSTNLFYTDARVNTYLSAQGYDTATNIVASITDSAPATLDTLNELAAALGDDANFSTTVTNSIATKLPLAGGTMTGVIDNFESTGIDDQATDTVLTILSNGSVGIGATGSARFTLSGTASANDLSSAMVFALGASTKLYLGVSNATDNIITGSSLGDAAFRTNGGNMLFSVDSGSSPAVYIKSDGNVGIGTTIPSSPLHVRKVGNPNGGNRNTVETVLTLDATGYYPYSGYGIGIDFKGEDYGNVAIREYAKIEAVMVGHANQTAAGDSAFTSALTFATNSGGASSTLATEKMRIDDSGNVGIGTTDPGATLDLRGHMRLDSGGSTSRSIYFRNQDGSATGGGQIRSDQHLSLWAGNGGGSPTQYLTIKPGGNVGIGTTSPGQKLTVAGGIESTSAQGSVAFYSTTAGSYNQQNGTGGTAWAYGSTGGNSAPNTAASTTFGLHHWNGSAWSNPLNVSTNGNIGIGTASPTHRLQVNGTAADGTELLHISSDGDVPDGGYHWMTSEIAGSQSTNANIIHLIGKELASKNSGYFGFHYAGDHSDNNFVTIGGYAADQLLNIKMNGNVGIGTTGPNESLHIYRASGDASFKLQHASQTLRIDQNSIRTTTDSAVAMFTNNNAQQGFRIENDGRMIIGNTSGQSNVKLTVNGNVKMGSAAASSWANTVNDIGGLDVIVGSGSHALQLWDDNQQSAPRFEVERAGTVTMGTTLHLHESRGGDAYSVSGSSQTYNLMMPSFYGSGSINQTYRHAYNINTPFHTTLWQGGGGNTVFTTWSKIGAEHYKDIYIETYTLYYSDIKIKVITDGNANVSVWYAGNTYNNNVYNARWRVYPLQACTVTMNPSSSQSAVYMVHQASGGRQESATDTATAGSGPSTW